MTEYPNATSDLQQYFIENEDDSLWENDDVFFVKVLVYSRRKADLQIEAIKSGKKLQNEHFSHNKTK